MSFCVENILDMISSYGEEDLKADFADFNCPQNGEIETYIKIKAIDFAKRKLSITYIVSDTSDGEIVGYFTLTHKALDINGSDLSNTSRKKLGNHSQYEADTDLYSTSAFLLAQFGKNYAVDKGTRISGTELMECVMDILADIQHRIGGGIVYLDAEDKPELRTFYGEKANYKLFGERYSKSDNIKYLQYMRFL
ncbi:MAG: GNAT family acetyltransferase [Lachnospiraceae bacterium]|nr:GNAT family acetyltransferase [Lachnospiraceae bacterium]